MMVLSRSKNAAVRAGSPPARVVAARDAPFESLAELKERARLDARDELLELALVPGDR